VGGKSNSDDVGIGLWLSVLVGLLSSSYRQQGPLLQWLSV